MILAHFRITDAHLIVESTVPVSASTIHMRLAGLAANARRLCDRREVSAHFPAVVASVGGAAAERDGEQDASSKVALKSPSLGFFPTEMQSRAPLGSDASAGPRADGGMRSRHALVVVDMAQRRSDDPAVGASCMSTMGAAGSRPYTGAAGMSRTGPELPLAVAAGEAVDLNKDLSPEARPPDDAVAGPATNPQSATKTAPLSSPDMMIPLSASTATHVTSAPL